MKKRLKKIIGCIALTITLGIAGIPIRAFALEPLGRVESVVFSEEDMEFFETARAALQEILHKKEVMALVYLTDKYPLRQEASGEAAEVIKLRSGQQVQIQDVVMTPELEAWVQVRCLVKGQEYIGYINRQNLACSDELFLAWEAEYGMNPAAFQVMLMTEGDVGQSTEDGSGEGADASEGESGEGEAIPEPEKPVYPDVEMFPESYQEALYALKELYPDWMFVKMPVNLEWDKVVEEELKNGRSLVYSTNPTAMKEGLYGQKWYYASKETVEYYLDPRSRLTENKIFQFEQLTYNESYHTEEALQSFLDNTFMKGNLPGTVLTYATAITAIGEELDISPFHLASRVYQEQGTGDSALISGNYPGYEGYYNYYNIGATGSSNEEVIVNGLEYAKKQNWTSPYDALYFGAQIIEANYIDCGQDTLYLQKFDVDDSDGELFWHQYMQNIGAPDSEGASIKKLYENAGALNNTFVFKIPVYENMPEEACAKPETSNRVVLDILDGYENQQVYLDGVPVTAVKKNGYYVAEAPNSDIKTAVMYQYDEKNIPVGMSVWELTYDGSGYLVNEVEGLKDVLSYHGFSIRITGRSGIRYKSGILQEAKSALTGEGVAGYTLKEYGTLLLTQNLLGDGYLTLSTEKAATGLSYGTGENGEKIDKVLERVDGRDRFASVLVGLPISEYQTEFAFRSYMILTKNDQEIVLYGPQNAKSIYTLATQIAAANVYQEGSSAQLFLEQIIADADEYAAAQQEQKPDENE